MGFKLRVATVQRVADYLLERDVTPASLLRRLDLPPFALLGEHGWLDRHVSLVMAQEIVRATGDPLAGIRMRGMVPLSDYGAWGRGIAEAPTLRHAITFACRRFHMITTGAAAELREDGRCARLPVDFLPPVTADPRHSIEGNLLLFRRILDLAVEPVPVTVRLPHERLAGADLESWYGPDLEFGADRPELVFDREALRLHLRAPEPWLEAPLPATTARRTMKALEELLAYERPTAQGVASIMGVSVRKMQRNLTAWGLTFEGLLDQYRHRMAEQYLESGDLSVTDIAFRLGYSDSAHFTRAFRRWNGTSPREYLRARKMMAPLAVPG